MADLLLLIFNSATAIDIVFATGFGDASHFNRVFAGASARRHRAYARIDMRLHETTGEPYILEVNPNPDLADSCAFAQSVRASGRTYAQAMNELVHYALEVDVQIFGPRRPRSPPTP